MKVYTDGRLPIKSWASSIEEDCLAQAINVANLPIAQSHIVLCPDTHLGYGVPIGCVIFTDGAVIPNAVGVDQGCGVAMLKTGLTVEDLGDKLQPTLNLIAARIPTGFRQQAEQIGRAHV